MQPTNSRKRGILVVLISILCISAIGAITWPSISSFFSEGAKKSVIKNTVSDKIDRKDFDVTAIVVESKGWQLAKIASTNEDDRGNPAYVILHLENGRMVLRFGPGTRFEKEDLQQAAVPDEILKALFGDQDKYLKDPIDDYLPYTTNYYSISTSSSGGESDPNAKTVLITEIFEVPRLGIYATPQKKAEYRVQINDWITSLGLDPAKYSVFFTN